MKVMAAQLNPVIGDIEGNARKLCKAFDRARAKGVDAVIFPEMSLLGYPPEDLLLDEDLIHAAEEMLPRVGQETRGLFAVIGTVRRNRLGKEKPLRNSAAVFSDRNLLGYHDKQLLPTYDVFDERRYFEPGEKVSVFEHLGRRIAVTICEDLWQHGQAVGYTHYREDPIYELMGQEVDLVVNISASPYSYRRKKQRLETFSKAARTLGVPLILCNQAGANDQLVFDGYSAEFNDCGELIQIAGGFVEEDLIAEPENPGSPCGLQEDDAGDLHRALVFGVRDYFHKQGFRSAIIGLSGGIDSAVAACIGCEALGKDNLTAFSLPSRFSSQGSVSDAKALAHRLGIAWRELSIEPLFEAALQHIEPHFEGRPWDIAEENMQSRLRGYILMAFSNKTGALLLTTGNKSEMAMGYTTLYGDMCGSLGVLQDVTKSAVYRLADTINRKGEIIPEAILRKAPSPELKAGQKTQDTLPPFEILDPILEDYLEERMPLEAIAAKRGQLLAVVEQIVAQIHRSEYKRRQAPIGIRVTQKAFSKGRNVPIVQALARFHSRSG